MMWDSKMERMFSKIFRSGTAGVVVSVNSAGVAKVDAVTKADTAKRNEGHSVVKGTNFNFGRN